MVARRVQERLQDMGFEPGPIDGQFGPWTSEALRRYQASRGLGATGLLDEATRDDLGISAHAEITQVDGQGASPESDGSATASKPDPMVARRVQERLQDMGFEPGPIDGQLGPQTSEALQRYQASRGLDTTGDLDEATRADPGMSALTASPQGDGQNDMIASAGSVTTFQPDLGVVQQVQESLQDMSFEPEAIAGKLGPLTSEALKRYQAIQGFKGPARSMKLTFTQQNHALQEQLKSNNTYIQNLNDINKPQHNPTREDISYNTSENLHYSSYSQYSGYRDRISISQLIQPMIIILFIAVPIYFFIQMF
jgi:peptidoglycan hydrolase-like protein with peptidoglycan-binding domain